MSRDAAVAAHEAAHVVVGVALGLRLRAAAVGLEREGRTWYEGFAWFHAAPSRRIADAVSFAAGVAWDRALGEAPHSSSEDYRLCRELCTSRHDVETCVALAAAILSARRTAHRRVTRALLERDLTAQDIAALARGERIEEK